MRRYWQSKLSTDGATPPTQITLRCMALLEGEPDEILSVILRDESGTHWRVIALQGSRLLALQADSPHRDWSRESMKDRHPSADPVEVSVTAELRPLHEVTSVALVPTGNDPTYFTSRAGDEGEAERFYGGWQIAFRDGSRLDLGLEVSENYATMNTQHETAERIVRRLIEHLSSASA